MGRLAAHCKLYFLLKGTCLFYFTVTPLHIKLLQHRYGPGGFSRRPLILSPSSPTCVRDERKMVGATVCGSSPWARFPLNPFLSPLYTLDLKFLLLFFFLLLFSEESSNFLEMIWIETALIYLGGFHKKTLQHSDVSSGRRELEGAEVGPTFGYHGFSGNGRDFLKMYMHYFGPCCNDRHPSL